MRLTAKTADSITPRRKSEQKKKRNTKTRNKKTRIKKTLARDFVFRVFVFLFLDSGGRRGGSSGHFCHRWPGNPDDGGGGRICARCGCGGGLESALHVFARMVHDLCRPVVVGRRRSVRGSPVLSPRPGGRVRTPLQRPCPI